MSDIDQWLDHRSGSFVPIRTQCPYAGASLAIDLPTVLDGYPMASCTWLAAGVAFGAAP